jgi:hypothetical protein
MLIMCEEGKLPTDDFHIRARSTMPLNKFGLDYFSLRENGIDEDTGRRLMCALLAHSIGLS